MSKELTPEEWLAVVKSARNAMDEANAQKNQTTSTGNRCKHCKNIWAGKGPFCDRCRKTDRTVERYSKGDFGQGRSGAKGGGVMSFGTGPTYRGKCKECGEPAVGHLELCRSCLK
jgi:hypothetical protein